MHMRSWSWGVITASCVIVSWVVAAIANFKFGQLQGTGEPIHIMFGVSVTSSQLNSWGSVAIDAMKGAMVLGVGHAYRHKSYDLIAVCLTLFVICTLWSLQSAVGYVLTERAGAMDERGQMVQQWSALTSDLNEAVKRRELVPDHRPTSVVAAEIEKKKISKLWIATTNCTQPMIADKYQREFCQGYGGLMAEKSAADEADKLDEKISVMRRRMDERRMVTSADPFASLIRDIFGVNIDRYLLFKGLSFAILMEAISALGPWVVFGILSLDKGGDDKEGMTSQAACHDEPMTSDDKDNDKDDKAPSLVMTNDNRTNDKKLVMTNGDKSVMEWSALFLTSDDPSHLLKSSEARAEYTKWSHQEITPITFGKAMKGLGYVPIHKTDGSYYRGVRIGRNAKSRPYIAVVSSSR